MRDDVKNAVHIQGAESLLLALEKFVGKDYYCPIPAPGSATKTNYTLITSPIFALWNITHPSPGNHREFARDSFSWRTGCWGTQSEAACVTTRNRSWNIWDLSFMTRWSSPHVALLRLSVAFPQLSITNTAYNVTRGSGNITKYYKGGSERISGWGDIRPASHEKFEDKNGVGSCHCHEVNSDNRPHISFALDCKRQHVSTNEALIAFYTANDVVSNK